MASSDIVPAASAWSSAGVGEIAAAAAHVWFGGHSIRTAGLVPIIHCHGFSLTTLLPAHLISPAVAAFRDLAATTLPVVAADLGGGSTWGNQATIDAIDDAVTWAGGTPSPPATRTDRVSILADSMGALGGLNWAWRQPHRVEGIVLRVPVTAMARFHDRNPAGFGAAIEAAYGGLAGYTAALPTHDPYHPDNIAKIRQFADRIQVWYVPSDEIVAQSEVEDWCAAVGIEPQVIPGGSVHLDGFNAPTDQMGYWFQRQGEVRLDARLDWDIGETDWARVERHNVTRPWVVVDESTLKVGADDWHVDNDCHGRMTVADPDGNDRNVWLLTGVPRAYHQDVEVYSEWYSAGAGPMTGQQGNPMRWEDRRPDGTLRGYMAWHDVLFGVPWIINAALWLAGPGADDLSLIGGSNHVFQSIRLASGGQVLASKRLGGVVTITVPTPHRVEPGAFVDVQTTSISATIQVTSVAGDQISGPNAGADVAVAGPGTYGNQSQGFPYKVRSVLRGLDAATTVWIKAWASRLPEPAWTDADATWAWTFTGPEHSHFGRSGFYGGHIGISTLNRSSHIDVGPVTVKEL